MKCLNCNQEFNFPETALKQLSTCPFCKAPLAEPENSIASKTVGEIIVELVKNYGREIFNEENEGKLQKALKSLPDECYFGKKALQFLLLMDVGKNLLLFTENPGNAESDFIEKIAESVVNFVDKDHVKKWVSNLAAVLGIRVNGIFVDSRDAEVYKTVKIGTQVWLAENFRYKCEDSFVYDGIPAYAEKYGRLYTWNSAMKCAPEGWHLPTREEWSKLKTYVDDCCNSDVSTSLKSKRWDDGTDEFGFGALPAGSRCSFDCFSDFSRRAFYWAATEYSEEHAYFRTLCSDEFFNEGWFSKKYACSVRLIKDS